MVSGKSYFVNPYEGEIIMDILEIPEGAEMHVVGIVFNPTFRKILVVHNKAYKGKPEGGGFPGGRTSTSALLGLLQSILGKKTEREILNILNNLFMHDNYEEIQEIHENLFQLKQENLVSWDDLNYGIREMLLREKLAIEVKDETGVEKDELTIINLLSCNPVTYPNKIVYRLVYFCMTSAKGIPRKHYKVEVDESRWFNINDLPVHMYRSHKEILFQTKKNNQKEILQSGISHLIYHWRKNTRR